MKQNIKKKSIAEFNAIDGNISSVFAYVLGKGQKAVYIQGGIHGGETTYWIFHRLYEELSKRTLNKQVVLVPLANPYSWQQKSYFYTVGKFNLVDGKDWLWNFPGSPEGSAMQRLTHQLYDVASSYDVSVDLHTSRKSVPFGIFSSDRYDKEINALGIPFNFVSKYGDSPEQFKQGVASLSYAMNMSGKRGFTLECGSHDDYNQKNIELMCDSLLNFLRLEGVIDEPVAKKNELIIFADSEFGKYKSPLTGFIQYLKQPGNIFAKGEDIISILDAGDIDKKTVVRATKDGTVLKISPTHIAQAGDVVMEVINKDGKK